MKRILIIAVGMMVAAVSVFAQKTDSVIINVGEKSKVIFAIGDKADLQTLKQYNFQAVVDDLVTKLEAKDSSNLEKPADSYLKTEESQPAEERPVVERDFYGKDDDDDDDKDDDDWDRSWEDRHNNDRHEYNVTVNTDRSRRYGRNRTRHSFNFDLGTNNYLNADGGFPNQDSEPYSVRPWGSWYVGINSVQRTRLARKFFLEWGLGVSWYNFKFENDKLRVGKDNGVITFTDDQRDVEFVKSKLTATYLNASLIPLIDFGGRSRRAMIFDGGYGGSFRIGVGPYAGYRIDSYSKLVYEDGKDRRRERDHDSYYLNNLRYGLRLQIGFKSTDLFFNYDMNELFATGKGPKLNAFSFGITL